MRRFACTLAPVLDDHAAGDAGGVVDVSAGEVPLAGGALPLLEASHEGQFVEEVAALVVLHGLERGPRLVEHLIDVQEIVGERGARLHDLLQRVPIPAHGIGEADDTASARHEDAVSRADVASAEVIGSFLVDSAALLEVRQTEGPRGR
jgi:hypothetical protein